ncbi:MAG: DinB family protein [Gracilimonas sp.]|uniref:DinB family protein n=1 Tax=Gracilimonas TaxID=649462 RepID=UPI001B0DE618|nr:DinB family protein [Gracilimonas sp.]MBO6584819.1 DinB family protein [Gracilimonas sp.]MBO6615910.1 DinB family protein [Gracilimonas sp.]
MDLEKLFEYDRWANEKILQAIRELDESETKEEVTGLLSHILAAQQIWMNRITGKETAVEIWPQFSIAEMSQIIQENIQKLKDLVAQSDNAITYQNSKGKEFGNVVGDILTHLIIHGQHHRAQIATLIRQAGQIPPGTDYIFFLRTVHN